ncbi:cell division protein ZapD [Achromobacter sp. GG226]|uniref:cell division protein ZapD n=1 Tax=Verticiella alkaliphila TaxID=2779529 RepID=UPI001C0AE984|nr:cell division protein ZapD [Verticiella sp. GG226]
MIVYEYPFNERVRNLLRLEDQLDRLGFFLEQEDPRAHHAALSTLFEITDAVMRGTGRSDVRSELLHELERQRQSLQALREHPQVEPGLLDAMLDRLQHVVNNLSSQARPADSMRQHEWLGSLRSRLVIPGGVCEFDMPSYYAWQQRPVAERLADLEQWCAPLAPLREALSLTLEMLRGNGEAETTVAPGGVYQQVPNGKAYQLLQVRLPDDTRLFPEISANKYSISIRFATLEDGQSKPQPVTYDVPFRMVLCTSL